MRLSYPFLYPFSLLYDGVTRLRNRMFDLGLKKSCEFEVPTIVVGNISWGGTGKTPMVEFLIKKLKENHHLAMLSRGYGRKTSGFLLADEGLSPGDIGDEPFQVFAKYGNEVTVAVGEQRILAIPQILADRPATDLIVLDDAFQHRYVKGNLNILLTTYQNPFFSDKIIPLGTLREHPKAASRADVIVVTKCPDRLDQPTKNKYKEEIGKFSGDAIPVLFAGLTYGAPYRVFGDQGGITHKVILVSGIANNHLLKKEVAGKYELLTTLEYPDHYRYREKDMIRLVEVFQKYKNQNPCVITTEKDAVKFKEEKILKHIKEIPIFALPVEISLDSSDEDLLLSLADQAIHSKNYSSET